jgi:hypothetical protein
MDDDALTRSQSVIIVRCMFDAGEGRTHHQKAGGAYELRGYDYGMEIERHRRNKVYCARLDEAEWIRPPVPRLF